MAASYGCKLATNGMAAKWRPLMVVSWQQTGWRLSCGLLWVLVDNKRGGGEVAASYGCKLATNGMAAKWRPLMGVS